MDSKGIRHQEEDMTVVSVVGARPNFIKLASVDTAFLNRNVNHVIIHTGQHFDSEMSSEIITDIGLRRPDFNLGIGGSSALDQISRITAELPALLNKIVPKCVIVYGDVTSTLGAAISAHFSGLKVAHVEAGYRSFDRSMPEEINRILTDHISDLCFTSHEIATEQLLKESIRKDCIFTVGSTALDLLSSIKVEKRDTEEPFILCTLHRPQNVDDSERLTRILESLNKFAMKIKIYFPIHPRTKKCIDNLSAHIHSNVIIVKPMRYKEFIARMREASLLITDSGGLQEESAFMGIPCLVLRNTTERPYLVESGNSRLIGKDLSRIETEAESLMNSPRPPEYRDIFSDGKAGARIADIIMQS